MAIRINQSQSFVLAVMVLKAKKHENIRYGRRVLQGWDCDHTEAIWLVKTAIRQLAMNAGQAMRGTFDWKGSFSVVEIL